MEIVKEGWVSSVTCEDEGFEEIQNELCRIRCFFCGNLLARWYVEIIESLGKLLPKDYLPMCCSCATRKALRLEYCLKCGEKTFIAWEGEKVVIRCYSSTIKCGWKKLFFKEAVKIAVNKYLSNLW